MTQKIQVINTVHPDYQLPGPPNTGLFIASTRLSTDCKEGEAPTVDLTYQSGIFTQLLPVTGPIEKRDIQDPPGFLIVRAAGAGAYEFRNIAIDATQKPLRSGIPFIVEKGQAVYLGEIHVSYLDCYGQPSIGLQVRDAWERDQHLIEKKLKNVRSEDVLKRVLPPGPPRSP